MYGNFAILAFFAFAYSLVSGRLGRTPVNGPVVYLAFGVLVGPVFLGLLNLNIDGEGMRLIAELTLALVLFSDAAHADLAVLRKAIGLPQRLLLVGLPLTIGLGCVAGALLLPGLGLLQIAILATLLAPTDAALGKAVVTNPDVPAPVREGLNVESGLNDGICVPILFTFLHLATSAEVQGSTAALVLKLVAEEIGIGAGVGMGLAVVAAWGLPAAMGRGWIEGPWLRIPVVALAFASFCLAQYAGGSGFIACFTGGLLFGALVKEHKEELFEGAEGAGEAMSLLTWVTFGAVIVLQHTGEIHWRTTLYAILSLTVIRMLPVYISLLGSSLRPSARLFVGWFGPRGLASIVFIVIVANENLPGTDVLISATVATVVLSVLGHGISANPLSARMKGSRG